MWSMITVNIRRGKGRESSVTSLITRSDGHTSSRLASKTMLIAWGCRSVTWVYWVIAHVATVTRSSTMTQLVHHMCLPIRLYKLNSIYSGAVSLWRLSNLYWVFVFGTSTLIFNRGATMKSDHKQYVGYFINFWGGATERADVVLASHN